MAIRHWHPAKIIILWILDFALLVALWTPCETNRLLGITMTTCFYTRNIVLWLILSIPAFVITWKWASRRQEIVKSKLDRQSDELSSAKRAEASMTKLDADKLINMSEAEQLAIKSDPEKLRIIRKFNPPLLGRGDPRLADKEYYLLYPRPKPPDKFRDPEAYSKLVGGYEKPDRKLFPEWYQLWLVANKKGSQWSDMEEWGWLYILAAFIGGFVTGAYHLGW